MKNKAKLAFELLEQEMEVIYKEDLMQFIGGSGYSSSGGYSSGGYSSYPLPNGGCYFNALSYLVYGNINHGSDMLAQYQSLYPNCVEYDDEGNMIGAYSDASITSALIGASTTPVTSWNQYFNGSGGLAMAYMNTGTASNPVWHNIVITGANSNNGSTTVDYFDPILNKMMCGSTNDVDGVNIITF